MHSDLANFGVWGPVTATLDWCEPNYQFSRYIAETANTFSNIFSVWIALHGILMAHRQSLPTRYVIGPAVFTLVGIGSFAFHATLLYEAQLADELPMICGASYGMFLLFDTGPTFGLRTHRARMLAVGIVIFNLLFSWHYYLYRNPVYHQVVFATLALMNAFRTLYLLRWSHYSGRIPDEIKSVIANVFLTGCATFAFGFGIWNLDNIFCDCLTDWKFSVGWPIAFLFEGHSWWHILTAVGSYFQMVGISYLTLCVKGNHRHYALVYSLGLPHVKRIHEEGGDDKVD